MNTIHPKSGWSLLNLAIEHRNLDFIRALVSKGVQLDIPSNHLQIFHALDSDIDSAVQQGQEVNFSIISLLAELGANLELRDTSNLSIREAAGAWAGGILRRFDEKVMSVHSNKVM